MNKSIQTLLVCFALLCLSFKIDETPLAQLLKQLAKITAAYPQEKVHLHTDKPYYAIGEDIWIKAYIVTAEKNEPSELSKVLYVDLIDQKNVIVKKLKLEITNGTANGHMSLINLLTGGNYRIRAYTNYMRNYDQGFFFEKNVTLGSITEKQIVADKKEEKLAFSLQFFPEGGSMLAGVRGKIGIKAITSNGMGANLSGYIENSKKEKVAAFSTEHAGMGAFALLAQEDEKYTAVVQLENGEERSFKLPEVAKSGFALAINPINDNLQVRVSATKDKIGGKEMFVIAQSNGVTYASFSFVPNQAISSANIPIKNFPTGIVHLTLFNNDGMALSERLVFVNHHDQLKIDINAKSEALTKNKSTFDLKIFDQNNNPVDGNFSVAVTDMLKVKIEEDDELTIYANLLLTSDLKGYIEKPNYYFNKITPDKEKQLDHLLLTQGWSRFVWQDIKTNKEPEITFRPEQSLEISGKITGEYGKPLPNAKVNLISLTPGLFLKLDTISDARGNFVFDRLDIPDTAKLMVQAKTGKDFKGINVSLNPSPKVVDPQQVSNSININPYLVQTKARFEELDQLKMLDNRILLNTVTITKEKTPVQVLNIKNSANASGSADHVIKKEQLEREINIYSAFYKIPSVKVVGRKIFRNRVGRSLSSNKAMLLIIDGIQIDQDEDDTFLNTINPKDLEGIEVLSSDYNSSVYGPSGAGGVIYLTTRKGAGSIIPATNTAKITDAGFSVQKEFYIPDYGSPKIDKKMADLRSTIYWNPSITTNTKGESSFNFFNAGTPSTYQLIIEGIDAFGNIGRKTITYEVK